MTGKFRMEIAVNLRALGLLGLRRGEGETLQEFRERAESLCALQCINDYEEILYGEKAAGQEMLETAVRERKELPSTSTAAAPSISYLSVVKYLQEASRVLVPPGMLWASSRRPEVSEGVSRETAKAFSTWSSRGLPSAPTRP